MDKAPGTELEKWEGVGGEESGRDETERRKRGKGEGGKEKGEGGEEKGNGGE